MTEVATAPNRTDLSHELSAKQRELLGRGIAFQDEVTASIDEMVRLGLIKEAPPTGQEQHRPGEQRFASPRKDQWARTSTGFFRIAEIVRPTDANGRTVVDIDVAESKQVGAQWMQGARSKIRVETGPDGQTHFDGIGIGGDGGTYKFDVNEPNPDATGADFSLAENALSRAQTAFDRATKPETLAGAPAPPMPLPPSVVQRP